MAKQLVQCLSLTLNLLKNLILHYIKNFMLPIILTIEEVTIEVKSIDKVCLKKLKNYLKKNVMNYQQL